MIADGVEYARKTAALVSDLLESASVQLEVRDIASYLPGDLLRCRANVYIGSLYNNRLPPAFIDDYFSSPTWVIWVGYNIWQAGPLLDQHFGYHYEALSILDFARPDERGEPTFFRDIRYNGQVFRKFGAWIKRTRKRFRAPYEMILLSPVAPERSALMATAVHNGTGLAVPYLLRAGTRLYLADNPFSFVDLDKPDRHLILRDQIAFALAN